MFDLPSSILPSIVLDTHLIARFALFTACILACSVGLAQLLYRLIGLPLIAGMILGGVLLGPTGINIVDLSLFAAPIQALDPVTGLTCVVIPSSFYNAVLLLISAAITVAFLLWMAGQETDLSAMRRVGIVAMLGGILGAVVPVIMVVALLWWWPTGGITLAGSLGTGLIFAATSVSIPVAMLMAQKKMHLRSSQATLGAAVVDDIFAVILVSLFMLALQAGLLGSALVAEGHAPSLTRALISMFLTVTGMLIVGHYGAKPVRYLIAFLEHEHLIIVAGFFIMLVYFAAAELMGGLAGITGAYFAGLFFKRIDPEHHALRVLTPFVNSVLLPLFLAGVGMQVNIWLLQPADILLVIVLTLVAVFSKFIGVAAATLLVNSTGFARPRWQLSETYVFGASMVARGEVGLVIATLLKSAHLMPESLYVISVVVITLTTILTPILLSFVRTSEHLYE